MTLLVLAVIAVVAVVALDGGFGGKKGKKKKSRTNVSTSVGSSGGSTSSGTSGSTPTRSSSPSPSPSLDPEAAYLKDIAPGTCLQAWWDGTEYSSNRPAPIGCSERKAYLKVTSVEKTANACPTKEASGAWSSKDKTVHLCVTRQLKVGDCFPVSWSGKGDNISVTNADHFALRDCDANKVPVGFDTLMAITKYFTWSDSKGKPPCNRGPGTRAWSWTLEARGTAVCAEFPSDQKN